MENIDKEIKERFNKHIMTEDDIDHHTLKHKKDKDLIQISRVDEGY
jgi:hypothetical protein